MMKTISRIPQLAAMVCVLLPLAVACPDGVGDDGGTDGGVDPVGECDVDTDCTGDDFCHAYLKTCVANCVVDTAACGDDTPICNEEDANGVRPFDNADYNNVCVCDDTSCAAGQVCSPDYGVCLDTCDATDATACATDEACYAIGADNFCQPACTADTDCGTDAPICDTTTGQCLQGCSAVDGLRVECGVDELCDVLAGTCFAGCTVIGEQDTCNATEVCVGDGTCEEECDDDLCLNSEELCQVDVVEVATYNQCVAVEDAVDTDCTSIDAFAAIPRVDDGPILIFSNFVEDTGVYAIVIEYFDADGDMRIGDLPAQYGLDYEIVCDEGACLAESVPPDDSGTDVFVGDETSGTVTLIKSLPAGLTQLSVQAIDAAGNKSNSVCSFPAE